MIDLVNNRINRQLSFGYDIGKGFVVSEEEVAKIIDQLVLDPKIAADLKMRLDFIRLQVVRSLGKWKWKPVTTQRHFNVLTSFQRPYNVVLTSCCVKSVFIYDIVWDIENILVILFLLSIHKALYMIPYFARKRFRAK